MNELVNYIELSNPLGNKIRITCDFDDPYISYHDILGKVDLVANELTVNSLNTTLNFEDLVAFGKQVGELIEDKTDVVAVLEGDVSDFELKIVKQGRVYIVECSVDNFPHRNNVEFEVKCSFDLTAEELSNSYQSFKVFVQKLDQIILRK